MQQLQKTRELHVLLFQVGSKFVCLEKTFIFEQNIIRVQGRVSVKGDDHFAQQA